MTSPTNKNPIPIGTSLYVHRRGDLYPCYATLVSFNGNTGTSILQDEMSLATFKHCLEPNCFILPNDQKYIHCAHTKDLRWLKWALFQSLASLQPIQQNDSDDENCRQIQLFHKQVHVSILFENINAIEGHEMSTHPRRYNCALICALHDMLTNHSIFDKDLCLLGKQQRRHTIEKSLKQFCLATIAFRLAAGPSSKICSTTRTINDLQYIDSQAHNNSKTFLRFFCTEFHPTYTAAFVDIQHGLENYDIHKKKLNLLAKKKAPLYNDESPIANSMHYMHYRLYDNLSSSFQKAFLNNALNILGQPSQCNNYSCDSKFPFLTPSQEEEMLTRTDQLWNIFDTNW
jgi:hypothetical protein